MYKFFYLLLLVSISLIAADKVQIYASKIGGGKTLVRANGDVVVLYKDYILNSDDAIYNRQDKILQLFGHVKVSKGSNYQLLGNYAKLNLANKEKEFMPLYLLDQKSELWMSAKKGKLKNNKLHIKTGMLSGCNPVDPLWKIAFSSSSYNDKTKWMNLFNARLYLYNIPIFYTPYFGYSLSKKRRSGLLIPSFGVSSDEGFYYQQPIYIAVSNWWDMEFRPQIRTLRGQGLYGTFRFVDSAHSRGEFTTGYFQEKNSYAAAHNLAHKSHYGYHLHYTNSDFINSWLNSDLSGQSGLYADIDWMNDVNFINLANNNTFKTVTSNQILSQVNMFYNTNKNYYGAYFRYYLDLSKANNSSTLQNLPTLQYHHYLSSFLKNHVLYDVDLQNNTLYRQLGKNAQQTTLSVPLTLQTSLFDNYLNLSYTSHFYAQHISFSSATNPASSANRDIYQTGKLYGQYNVFDINTALTKAYKKVTHTITVGASYTQKGANSSDGFYKTVQNECSTNPASANCLFYNVNNIVNALQFNITQYFFNEESKQFLYDRTSQQVTYNHGTQTLGNLENEINYNVTNSLNIYNDTFYNHTKSAIAKSLSTIGYHKSKISLALSYLYNNSFLNTPGTTQYTKYFTSSFTYIYNNHYRYFTSFNYDLEAGRKKSASIGFLYSKRCWDFGLSYVENTQPTLTANGQAQNIDSRYILFTIVLKPIGGSQFNYRIPQAATGT